MQSQVGTFAFESFQTFAFEPKSDVYAAICSCVLCASPFSYVRACYVHLRSRMFVRAMCISVLVCEREPVFISAQQTYDRTSFSRNTALDSHSSRTVQ